MVSAVTVLLRCNERGQGASNNMHAPTLLYMELFVDCTEAPLAGTRKDPKAPSCFCRCFYDHGDVAKEPHGPLRRQIV